MKLVADSGLWSTGPLVAPTPLVAVLEVSGAVLSWAIDEEPAPRPSPSPTWRAPIGCGGCSANPVTAQWPRRWTDGRQKMRRRST